LRSGCFPKIGMSDANLGFVAIYAQILISLNYNLRHWFIVMLLFNLSSLYFSLYTRFSIYIFILCKRKF
jgi:hypothetical protein